MTTTTASTDCLRREIERDLAATCCELAEARRRQHRKDSTSNRAQVAACRARIDALLDLHLEAQDRGL